MAGALHGLLVADFSRVLAGPYATMLLADHGADVVKVESPDGDATRAWGPPYTTNGQTTYFSSINRNKRSVVLNLQSPADRELAFALAAKADIVIENFMPGRMSQFGLGYEQIRVANPSVVYCSITGFGTGEGANEPGYDLLVQAMGGLMSITGIDEPTRTGVAVVDVLTGLHATVGILAAVRHRDETGQGQQIEVSLMGALLSSLVNQSASFVNGGEVPGLTGNAHPSIAPYQVFHAADRPMVVAVGTDRQFRRFVLALGLPELADDPRFASNSARVTNRIDLADAVGPALATHDALEWRAILSADAIPCGPVNDMAQAFGFAADLGLDPIVLVANTEEATIANPVQLAQTPPSYRLAPPDLDEHRVEVRSWLEGLVNER